MWKQNIMERNSFNQHFKKVLYNLKKYVVYSKINVGILKVVMANIRSCPFLRYVYKRGQPKISMIIIIV